MEILFSCPKKTNWRKHNEQTLCKSPQHRKGSEGQFYHKKNMVVTEHLGVDGTIVMCIESLFREEPTILQMEAIEPSICYGLPKQKLEEVALHNVKPARSGEKGPSPSRALLASTARP